VHRHRRLLRPGTHCIGRANLQATPLIAQRTRISLCLSYAV
jgi:hypothetical protein